MILIGISEVIAELLPEVCHSIDPDIPPSSDLPLEVRKYLRALLMRAFHRALSEEFAFDMRWVLQVKQDGLLTQLSDRRWIDVEVMDTDGTFILTFEDL